MKKIAMFISLAIAFSLMLSCTDNGGTDIPVNDWPWQQETETPEDEGASEAPETPEDNEGDDVKVEPNKAIVDAGWENVGDDYGELPEHISVYKSPSKLEEKAAIAYIAVADLTKGDWDVWSVKSDLTYKTSDSYKTPAQVYEATKAPIITNAGYFYYSGGNYTSSLAVSEGKLLAYNINYASEDWVSIYYPTRAALVEKKNGEIDACWTYVNGSGNHYTYQIPADNSYDEDPLQAPSATFPEKGVKFEAQTAIGGGPALINKGEFANTWKAEMFDVGGVNPTTNQPRTAVGVTADSKMILFVCEGRNMTEGIAGLTTEDVANVLLDLGCVEAINLDGGGSSCMLVNGKETIKVSDGKQRAVASTVMLK